MKAVPVAFQWWAGAKEKSTLQLSVDSTPPLIAEKVLAIFWVPVEEGEDVGHP